MGKVILTEGQYQRLKKRLINNMINEVDYGSIASGALAGGAAGAALGLAGIVPGAMVGVAANMLRGAGGSRGGVMKMFSACKSQGVGKSTMAGSTLDEIAAKIHEAISGAGTWENNVYNALNRLQTIPDLCSLITRYSENYPGSSLWGDLDGDFDSDSEWNEYIYTPLLKAKRKSEELAAKAAQAKKTTTGGGGAGSISEKNWMILYSQLQKMGLDVQLTSDNKGLYWGKAPLNYWGIWRDSSKNGGYPFIKGNPPTNTYKFLDGVYQGQSLNDMYVIEKGKPGVPIKVKDLIGAKTVSSKSAVKPKVGASAKKPVAKKPSSPSMPDIDFSSGLK